MTFDSKNSNHPEVEYDNDYHGHPNYAMIFIALLVLLAISVVVGFMGESTLVIMVVFGTAALKAYLVVTNFMHIRFEPKVVWILPIAGVLAVAFFYFGVLPDIRAGVPLEIAK